MERLHLASARCLLVYPFPIFPSVTTPLEAEFSVLDNRFGTCTGQQGVHCQGEGIDWSWSSKSMTQQNPLLKHVFIVLGESDTMLSLKLLSCGLQHGLQLTPWLIPWWKLRCHKKVPLGAKPKTACPCHVASVASPRIPQNLRSTVINQRQTKWIAWWILGHRDPLRPNPNGIPPRRSPHPWVPEISQDWVSGKRPWVVGNAGRFSMGLEIGDPNLWPIEMGKCWWSIEFWVP